MKDELNEMLDGIDARREMLDEYDEEYRKDQEKEMFGDILNDFEYKEYEDED